MAAIAVLPYWKPKEFRFSHHLDELTSGEFIARYRLSKNGVSFLENLLKDDLQRQTNRNRALTSIQQIFITLRFFGTGAFYSVIGDTLGFHKCTVCRVVENVSDAIIKHLHEFVVWPSPAEKERVKQGFYAVAGFPNVIGCIDGTHIRIQAPHDYEASYVNRKGFDSIHAQAVCDHQGVNVSWPGSCHDNHIFRTSGLCAKLERKNQTFAGGVLLGDSSYQCKVYMMTPFLATEYVTKERYQQAHARTRTVIERSFGRLKRRFAMLHFEVRLSPAKLCKITTACVNIYTIYIALNGPDIDSDENQDNDNAVFNLAANGNGSGTRIRDYIVNRYFE